MSLTTGHPSSSLSPAITAPVEHVDAYLTEFLNTRPLPDNLREALLYAALAPGKRLRPLLVIHACNAVGGSTEAALPPAAALEMVHAFSLVHDDLPAMDDDDLRRGRPTLHRHTNEAMAILAGDALFGLAFELILSRVSSSQLAGALASELAVASNNMIVGQVYDTLGGINSSLPPLERLKLIHRNKTGALILSACRSGAIAGEADPAQLKALSDYAQAVGLMFQIVDDLLDVTQSTEHLGKTAGKDAQQNKLTYPSVMGLDDTRHEISRLHADARTALKPLASAAQPLLDLVDYLAVRTK